MMKMKEQAYQLHKEGLSYSQIGEKIGKKKTTAYEYVQAFKEYLNGNTGKPIDINPKKDILKLKKDAPPSKVPPKKSNESPETKEKPPVNKIKEFTGDEILLKEFDSLEFTGKFLELIGRPSRIFSAIIWGLPKGGKSNLSLRFADYLQEYFGDVVYIAAEEGESVTLRDKFKEIGGSKVLVAETRNKDEIREYLKSKSCDFVFIDSINNAGIDSDFLEILKIENPDKSFISIVQATKSGTFKGDQSLTHNCDFIIKVVAGIAYQSGRFNTATEISIFDEPLYKKNPNPRPKKALMLPEADNIDSTADTAIMKDEDTVTAEIKTPESETNHTDKKVEHKPLVIPIPSDLPKLAPMKPISIDEELRKIKQKHLPASTTAKNTNKKNDSGRNILFATTVLLGGKLIYDLFKTGVPKDEVTTTKI